MIYESMSGLLLTLFVPAGNCHGRIVLLSVISTEASPSTIYYTLFSFFCHSCWISVPLLLMDWCFFGFCSYQRQAKYTENRLKAIKARNEYLLALEATNSCVFKYYIHDLSDIIDVSINTR